MQKIEKNSFFCLFPKRHADLYKMLRKELTGGLSIVFCRYAAAGETQIRNHKISNLETTEKILGLDANSLYLHAIVQNNPTGYFGDTKNQKITDRTPALDTARWPISGCASCKKNKETLFKADTTCVNVSFQSTVIK